MVLTVVSSYIPDYDNIGFTIAAQDLTGKRMVSLDKFIVTDSYIYSLFWYPDINNMKYVS